MMNIDVELDNDLIEGVKQLAARHYGDSSDTSMAHVAESALEMRLLWLDLVKGEGNEIEEPIYRFKQRERTPLWDKFWENI